MGPSENEGPSIPLKTIHEVYKEAWELISMRVGVKLGKNSPKYQGEQRQGGEDDVNNEDHK